jgi:AcrR family transcriptional regulator
MTNGTYMGPTPPSSRNNKPVMSAPNGIPEPSPWTPFEDRRRARDEKREAVLNMAVRLFLEDGYHRTPLAKVAERLNITKPALYNYFRSKEEILHALYRQGDEQYEASFGRIERGEGDGLHKLRELIRAYARIMTTDRGMCFARLDDRELGEAARAEVRRSKRRYDVAFRKQIEQGIVDGSILPCDAKLAAFMIGGALNGIADWYHPEGALLVETIANEFALRLTEGLAAKRSGAPTGPTPKPIPKAAKS